jgi:hypothetical protein
VCFVILLRLALVVEVVQARHQFLQGYGGLVLGDFEVEIVGHVEAIDINRQLL